MSVPPLLPATCSSHADELSPRRDRSAHRDPARTSNEPALSVPPPLREPDLSAIEKIWSRRAHGRVDTPRVGRGIGV